MRAWLVVAAAAIAACAHSTTSSMPSTVVLVAASAEWKPVTEIFPRAERHASPYGEWLIAPVAGEPTVFFHGGYGKVAAAGSTQYAIDHWHPRLLVQLGTCGGFGGDIAVGDIVLVTKTIIYDLYERQGDAAETIADYSTAIDTSRWPAALSGNVRRGPIASGDRDLDPREVAALHAKYAASAGDWESGAVAYVAARSHVPIVILRAVTDLVDPATANGDATYGDIAAWQRAADTAMRGLVDLLAQALPALRS